MQSLKAEAEWEYGSLSCSLRVIASPVPCSYGFGNQYKLRRGITYNPVHLLQVISGLQLSCCIQLPCNYCKAPANASSFTQGQIEHQHGHLLANQQAPLVSIEGFRGGPTPLRWPDRQPGRCSFGGEVQEITVDGGRLPLAMSEFPHQQGCKISLSCKTRSLR